MKSLITFGVIAVLAVIAFGVFTFSVDETQTAVVRRFGEIVRVAEESGLYFKLPFVHSVTYLEDRILN